MNNLHALYETQFLINGLQSKNTNDQIKNNFKYLINWSFKFIEHDATVEYGLLYIISLNLNYIKLLAVIC